MLLRTFTAMVFCLALGAFPQLSQAALVSISFDMVEDYMDSNFSNGVTTNVPVGPPSNTDGLELPGQVGPWDSLIVGNGAVNITWPGSPSITVGSTTFTWNTNSSEMYFTFNSPGDDLRGSVPFLRATGNLSTEWEFSGLVAGEEYDIIFFGQQQGGNAVNPADVSILGHDAGNGIGSPVTLDADNDANFTSVIADASGTISGVMAVRPGEAFAALGGVQIDGPMPGGPSQQVIPEPTSLATFGLLSVFGLLRRRH